MTAHKPHVRACHAGGQAQLFDQQQIKTRCTETTAGDCDQMRNLLRIDAGLFDGRCGSSCGQPDPITSNLYSLAETSELPSTAVLASLGVKAA